MPQIPTYIRQADWDKYIAIQSKGNWPAFIHNALSGVGELEGGMIGLTPAHIAKYGGAPDTSLGKPIKTPKIVQKGTTEFHEIDIPLKNSDPICKRHHVPMSICGHKH